MGKKQKCPEFENHERWLVSYADMLTLLFAVFVVLFALKEGGQPQNQQQAAASLQESFNTPLEDIPLDRRVGPAEEGFGIFEHMRGNQVRPPLTRKYPSSPERVKIINTEIDRVRAQLNERLYGPHLHRDADAKGNERIVTVERTATGFKLRLLARYFYESGSHQIRREALPGVDEIASVVKSLGRRVTIEGHTDSLPPQGQFTNWEISALRATTLVRYFIRNHLIPQSRLQAAGYADTRPIASNSTEEGRSLNRRIEIHVHYDDDEVADPLPTEAIPEDDKDDKPAGRSDSEDGS